MNGPLRRNLLTVRVTPKASRNEITGLYRAADGAVSLSVKVTAAPDKGQANAAVIKVLAQGHDGFQIGLPSCQRPDGPQ